MRQKRQKPQPNTRLRKEERHKPLMCKSYKGFGGFSLAVGMIFLAIMLVSGINTTRIAVAAFFIMLGAVDLLFYSRYG